MGIYAALKVPEVWRLNNLELTFHVLGADGQYHQNLDSQVFPQVTPADLMGSLALRDQMDENAVVQKLRVWIREQLQ